MLDAIASSSFGFWTIAALIVLIDSVVLLTPGEFVFGFDRHGKPVVRAAATPYLVRSKDLSFASLIFFARPFFVSSATVREVPDDELAALARQAFQHRSIYLYSAVTAFLLVVAGPVLAALLDISSALLVVLPVLYANAIIALADVIISRQELRLSRKALLSLAFEFIVCPALVTNLNKRLLDRSIVPNTLQLVGGDQALQHRIKANLEFHELPGPQLRLDRNG
ncbi:MAG: hypothetical protein ACJ8F2_22390 [Xanthobacteraceae bacterium]